MLEGLATEFLSKSDSELRAISFGLLICGAVVAGVFPKRKVELARSPYFAYSALIVLLVGSTELVWLLTLEALNGGYLWILVLVSMAASVFGGFYLCKIAIARSRDAYGHGRMAVLAFIPLANLCLFLTSSQRDASTNRIPTIPLVTNRLGVLTGVVLLLGAFAVSSYVQVAQEKIVERSRTEPAAQRAGIKFMLDAFGLEKTLHTAVAETQTPITIDPSTSLVQVEASKNELRRTYTVSLPNWGPSKSFQATVKKQVCAHLGLHQLLKAGATIREIYVTQQRQIIFTVNISLEDCVP